SRKWTAAPISSRAGPASTKGSPGANHSPVSQCRHWLVPAAISQWTSRTIRHGRSSDRGRVALIAKIALLKRGTERHEPPAPVAAPPWTFQSTRLVAHRRPHRASKLPPTSVARLYGYAPITPPSVRRMAIVAERGRAPEGPSGQELTAFG